ncbi:FkbM family methyltransferase [Helicobacter brantae]|uniref:SAM-dependent methyltransferase n=1 Tax=Helicobacter brantae TaxID=375927 RepID=A0A3D8J3M8_9HELI|nr:FkbM family methyltransferase [Helicobacter brantae]RDU72127.1 SAM-dependent methyltransferase [Helicobacter brantae]
MKSFIRKILPYWLYRKITLFIGTHLTHYAKMTYSQEGEDMILRSFLQKKINSNYQGFYVDIGAHHPFRYSNTYFLYKNGWRGINIDATPGSMRSFNLYRKRDINLEVGITTEKNPNKTTKDFFIFHDFALSTFDEQIAQERKKNHSFSHVAKIRIENINNIFKKYIPKGQTIDLLTLDTEGLDLEILQDIDWDSFAPQIVLVETYSDDIFNDPIYNYMLEKNYKLFAKTTLTTFFIKQ